MNENENETKIEGTSGSLHVPASPHIRERQKGDPTKWFDVDLSSVENMLKRAFPKGYIFNAIVGEFLNSEPDNIFDISAEFPIHRKRETFVAVNTLVEKSTLIREIGADSYEVYPIKYEQFEIKPGEFIEAAADGLRLLNRDGTKFALHTEVFSNRVLIAVYSLSREFSKEVIEEIKALMESLNFLRGQIIQANGDLITLEEYTWDDLIAHETTKAEIQQNVESIFNNAELYKKFGLPTKRGIILHGSPGNGKTQCIRVLACNARANGITAIIVTAKDVLTDYDGYRISGIYELASWLAPTLVVLEDFDLYAKERDIESHSGALGELLNEMDGVETHSDIVTVVTTNRIDTIEPALKDRPGRFDRHFKFEEPKDKTLVADMYRLFGGDHLGDVDVDHLARKTPDHFSGAHIHEVVTYAAMLAVENESYSGERLNVTKKLVLQSIERVKHINEERKRLGFAEVCSDIDDPED